MFLIINGRHNEIEWTDFMCRVKSHESAFDLLSAYVAGGLTLLKVSMVDEGGRSDLPVEAFDGQSFSIPMGNLMKELRDLKKTWPLPATTLDKQHFDEWNLRLQAYYEKQIALLEIFIQKLEIALRKASESPNLPAKDPLVKRYKLMLQSHKKQLDRAKIARRKVARF